MKKTRIGLLVAALLCAYPTGAWAQKKGGAAKGTQGGSGQAAGAGDQAGGDQAAGAGDQGAGAGDQAAGAGDQGAGDQAAGAGDQGAGAGAGDQGLPGGLPEGGGLGDICKIDPQACPHLDMNKEAAKPLKEQIYAMQQLFVLRVHRLELNPYWSFTLNDQFVGHNAPGIGLNYYISNVLAIGANFNYYQPFNSDSAFNAELRRSARVSVPLTEYQWGAALNFSYVPAIGKFAGFGDFIFHYDVYVVGGVGALSTRPIPVIDPDNRNFSYKPKLAFNAGLGLRIFLNRWFAATLEVRDYIYNEQLESLTVPQTVKEQQNPDNWYGDTKLTNNVQAQLGVSIFLPFSFEYRLPK